MSETGPQDDVNAPQGEEQLRRAAADCEARLAAFADLAARVRHEINNPLTGLLGQTQLLMREDLSASVRRRVEIIEQLAGRIRDTVAELRLVPAPDPARDDDCAESGAPPRH
ncbi:MAG TPA: histidine kinase dimerization/phospho-acceptor domain-containing protein [Pyrinomonadaceae bacterium]|jgi:two-component system NtrC family sensor kinase|nr:histidine kinase dimerization/phospho-acceptor domain-containing protein [Pyrinomonadaceae bacterium]